MRLFLAVLVLSASFFARSQSWQRKTPVDLSDYFLEKPELEQLQCFEVTYLSDGFIVNGLILEPKIGTKHPAIIFNRGGNREFALLSKDLLVGLLGTVASKGFVVTATNYRWEDEYGGADTNDVLNLLEITKKLPNVDSTRIGMLGWSRGAMMTCIALKGSHQIKSAVLVSGAPDLFSTLRERPGLENAVFSNYIPNYTGTKNEALMARSPHFWTDKLDRNTSLLILNGSNDRQVDYHQAERFSARLDSIKFQHEFKVFETDHSFLNMRPELDSILLDWFVRTLKSPSKRVAITIDDVPNTRNFAKNDYKSKLLEELDDLSIPTAIFINEGLVFRGDTVKNKELLENWISRSYVTPANHTYAHSRYSEVGLEAFSQDVLKGELLSRDLMKKYHKPLNYFRFPYNDLGSDSLEHVQINRFLEERNYISTPFTIETSDWMFNAVYENYLDLGDTIKAAEIGRMYVNETLRSFAFYDSLMNVKYGRSADQIYLCHDNRLNEDYLGVLISKLKDAGCSFISLDEAMKDPIYRNEDQYWKKWGISWCFRWMNPSDRKMWMQLEPDLGGIEEIYRKMVGD